MKRILSLFVLTAVSLIIVGCGGGTETNENTNTNTEEQPKSVAEQIQSVGDSLTAAAEKNDASVFEANLWNDFVGVGAGGFVDKAWVLKYIADNKCDVKNDPGTDRNVTELADGIALATAKGSQSRTCDGKTEKMSWNSASLWVKDGDSWKIAYRQTVPTSKPEAADAAREEEKPAAEGEAKKEEPAADVAKAEEKPAAEEKKEEAPAPVKLKSDDDLARTFAGIENDLWAAWAKKDTKPFEEVLAPNFSEVHADGVKDRAAVLKGIAENKCEITSSSISDTSATKVNDNFVIFTYKGMAKGTCDGQAIPDTPMYVTTLWMKDGENWKAVFHMESQEMK